jgi:hypothetical protein
LSWWLLHHLSIETFSHHGDWLVRVYSAREEVGRSLNVRQRSDLDIFFSIRKLLLLLLVISVLERILNVAAKVLGLSGQYF